MKCEFSWILGYITVRKVGISGPESTARLERAPSDNGNCTDIFCHPWRAHWCFEDIPGPFHITELVLHSVQCLVCAENNTERNSHSTRGVYLFFVPFSHFLTSKQKRKCDTWILKWTIRDIIVQVWPKWYNTHNKYILGENKIPFSFLTFLTVDQFWLEHA